jgi:hypothetical protein
MKHALMILVSILLATGCAIETDIEKKVVELKAGQIDPTTIENEVSAVEIAYEHVYGVTLSRDDSRCLRDIPVLVVSVEEMSAKGTDVLAYITDVIAVRADLNPDERSQAIAHEFTHQIGWCMGDPDNLHANPKMFTCKGSVEIEASEALGVVSRSYYKCAK